MSFYASRVINTLRTVRDGASDSTAAGLWFDIYERPGVDRRDDQPRASPGGWFPFR